MSNPETIMSALAAPFAPEAISWRVGRVTKDGTKAIVFPYIDARDVMDRLDEACGPVGWQCDYIPMPNGTYCCRVGIWLGEQWQWRSGGAGATDVEGEKGGYSDAFKRAAVLWGIGRYLYNMGSPWVEIDEWKQIKKSELPKLTALLARNGAKPTPPNQLRNNGEWQRAMSVLQAAIPLGRDAVDDASRSLIQAAAKWPDDWRDKLQEAIERAQSQARDMAA